MTNKQVGFIVGAIVLVGLALGFVLTHDSAPASNGVGATPSGTNSIENYLPGVLYNGGIYSALPIQTTSDVTGSLGTFTTAAIGSGSTISRIKFGTCALIVQTTISATSTRNYDCAVSGVTTEDTVVLVGSPATSTPAQGGVFITGASASTTSGYITFTVVNLTGTTYNPATTGFGSSIPYVLIK